MTKYDFIIVGAGFFGATCARLLTDNGYKCLIVEKENQVGGFAATKEIDGVMTSLYGIHIIKTNDKEVFDFLSKFDNILPYFDERKYLIDNKIYNLPISLTTFYELNSVIKPEDAKEIIKNDIARYGSQYPGNLEEEAIHNFGFNIYEKIIKPYSEKLWGKPCKEISKYVIKNFNSIDKFTSSYNSELYQGIPEHGYTKMIENMIGDDIDIMLNKDFDDNIDKFMSIANCIIYTGPIDKFSHYIYGPLDWNTLKFTYKTYKNTLNIQGSPVINYGDSNNLTLSILENNFVWKNPEAKHTVTTMITADNKWTPEKKCFYSINSNDSEKTLDKYIDFTKANFPNVLFGGRQGFYRNLTICESVRYAIDMCKEINSNS